MAEEKVVFQFDGEREMEISTGKVAGLANGSCPVSYTHLTLPTILLV